MSVHFNKMSSYKNSETREGNPLILGDTKIEVYFIIREATFVSVSH